MNANITKLQTSTTPKASQGRKTISKTVRKTQQQALAAKGIIGVALVLTALSLTKLSGGIELITHCDAWQSWALAIGVDCGFVSMELATMAVATDKLRKKISRYTRPAIICTMAGSASINALGFAWGSTGYAMQAASVALGIAIPALVYVLTRVGAEMLIDQRQQ